MVALNHYARLPFYVYKYIEALYMFSIIQKIMKDMDGWSRLMHEILEVPGIIYET